jgi:hypothetical protein
MLGQALFFKPNLNSQTGFSLISQFDKMGLKAKKGGREPRQASTDVMESGGQNDVESANNMVESLSPEEFNREFEALLVSNQSRFSLSQIL